MRNRATLFITAATAAVLAGTSFAGAQVLRDDPPGSLFQDQKNLESKGIPPENAYRYRAYRSPRGAYGYYPGPLAPRRAFPRAPY
jgi:hypothetical protein